MIASALLAMPWSSAEAADPHRLGVESWALPVGSRASQPDLSLTPAGDLLLSWLEPGEESGHRLRFSRIAAAAPADAWSEPATIATGTDWFVNWADTPHVLALADGSLWAHWLRSTGPGRLDYGVDLVRSDDGGRTWSAPRMVNLEDSSGDHGFVSFWPQSASQLGIAWLDSRQKAAAASGAADGPRHDHAAGPAMMLRAAIYDGQVDAVGEWPLDASVCDCCPTDSALTAQGPVVVYRGRRHDEIRDTWLVRFDGRRWGAPVRVHADGWRIPGCPVNGPAVAAEGDAVWVAWYTEADGVPELRLAHSSDAGARFGTPVTIARGPDVLGRVSMDVDGTGLWVAWLEEASGDTPGQALRLARYDGNDLQRRDAATVARLQARGRASGLPRLRVADGVAHLAWTDVAEGQPILKGALARYASPGD